MGMIPGMDLATGGGDMSLGDNSSASGTGSKFGNISGANIGTVSDKSWLFNGGSSRGGSERAVYYVGAALVVVLAVAGTAMVMRRK